MSEILRWLESPEGEEWSRAKHRRVYALISIKDDYRVSERYVWAA
jgi:hypothetical protein